MIIGLTGGIGSGKTTVAQIFQQVGIPVFFADDVSKGLLDSDLELRSSLVQLLGKRLLQDGKVDRSWMAQQIFSDTQLLTKVNALIHPAVAKAFKNWFSIQKAPYVLREAAILYESGSYKDCDAVIVVSAPEAMRIERVVRRSGESEEQVRNRMEKQWPQEKKLALADFVIQNDHQEMLIPQVLEIHEDLIRRANQSS